MRLEVQGLPWYFGMALRIGTAGWGLSRAVAEAFGGEGTHLERYARRMNAVEINSSFYRPHRRMTYERWAAATPEDFRFSVKVPKRITHEKRLRDCAEELRRFLEEIGGLGSKLGPLLVQLPPKLAWEESVAGGFFEILRGTHGGCIVFEPRHPSWFGDEPTEQLVQFRIARVAADPSVVAAAALPGGDLTTCYFRWHGSPRVYYSTYVSAVLEALATQLIKSETSSRDVWCIFDNTALGAAIENAMKMMEILTQDGRKTRSTKSG